MRIVRAIMYVPSIPESREKREESMLMRETPQTKTALPKAKKPRAVKPKVPAAGKGNKAKKKPKKEESDDDDDIASPDPLEDDTT